MICLGKQTTGQKPAVMLHMACDEGSSWPCAPRSSYEQSDLYGQFKLH